MQSWIDNPKNLYKQEYLDKSYNEVKDSGIKLELLMHQKKTVKAMIDLENKKTLKIDDNKLDKSFKSYLYTDFELKTSYGILNEKPGSGKTIELLSLIALNKPSKTRESINIKDSNLEITREYINTSKQTVIFVSRSVMYQWYEAIKKYTNLNVFLIKNQESFTEFYKIYKTKNLKKWDVDIILVKTGYITGKFDVSEMSDSIRKHKLKHIINLFADVFRDTYFRRVIIDDFDINTINTITQTVSSIFTWLVSSTVNDTKLNSHNDFSSYEKSVNRKAKYVDLLNVGINCLNIGCTDSLIEKSIKLTNIDYYLYKFYHANEKYTHILESLGAGNIAEMMNSGAYNTAAKELNLESKSIIDIIKKILGGKWHRYSEYLSNYKTITECIKILESKPIGEINNIEKYIDKNIYKSKIINKITDLKFSNNELLKLYNIEALKLKKQIDDMEIILNKVKEKIIEGVCPFTLNKLNINSGIIIMSCCGSVISNEGAELTYNETNNICKICNSYITGNSFIIVDKNFNNFIENLLNNNLEESNKQIIQTDMQKLNKIKEIINNKSVPDSINDIFIPNIMQGTVKSVAEHKKVIIFCQYHETVIDIEKSLKSDNINYRILNGTPSQIDKIIKEYNETIDVLIIVGPTYCAGLNLQFTTDIIFFHNILTKQVETQIIGRAARYGRKNTLTVHFLLYNSEFDILLRNYPVKKY